MAKLTREDILKLAKLAKLHLTDDEVDAFAEEIGSILGYIEQLKDVDVAGVKPTYQVTGLVNVMRSDEVADYNQVQEELLKNRPAKEGEYIKVKRMLG